MKSPKAIRLVTALSVFALLAILAPLVAGQGKQDFSLYNRTGLAITELYISPAAEDEWGDATSGSMCWRMAMTQ
jgi:hypothetical protein